MFINTSFSNHFYNFTIDLLQLEEQWFLSAVELDYFSIFRIKMLDLIEIAKFNFAIFVKS